MFQQLYRNTMWLIATCLMASVVSGCLSDPDRAYITGNVTLDGKPLPSGMVAFVGESGYSVASGVIKNGYYQIAESSNRKGIAPGNYRVQFESWIEPPGSELPGGRGFSKGVSAIPQKYESYKTSELNIFVDNTTRVMDFKLVTP